MQTIRGRLTLAYTLALTLTLTLFSAALYLDTRQAAIRSARATLAEDLRTDAEIVTRWLEVQWLRAQEQSRPSLLTQALGPGGHNSALSTPVLSFLAGVRSWVYVTDGAGKNLFVSEEAQRLDVDGVVMLQSLLPKVSSDSTEGEAMLIAGEPPFLYLAVPIAPRAGPEITTLLLAQQMGRELIAPRSLLVSIALVGPFILLASALIGYWLAGRSLRQVDVMIRDLAAIQGGTSLHRRLAVPGGGDELARLARTLNAMLGRVERSFVALRRFTADASHELKTPLMAVRAGVERSLTHPQSPVEVVSTLDDTLGQVNRMAELVGNLLTLARADEGRASLVLREVDLRALAVEVWETAELLGEEHGLASVTLESPSRPVRAMVDPPRIRELLLNLVTNAIKYTPTEGRVVIRLHERESEAVLEVEDTGIGIAAGDLPHIFERFWRVDQVRSREGERGGTGLGLAIARWIVDAHRGTIQVRSRPGRGSTFVVTLPLSATETVASDGESD